MSNRKRRHFIILVALVKTKIVPFACENGLLEFQTLPKSPLGDLGVKHVSARCSKGTFIAWQSISYGNPKSPPAGGDLRVFGVLTVSPPTPPFSHLSLDNE